ncbi:MAG: hypothetical protein A3B29_05125 [Candidatus Sungbacteria bacterium RIFCSPLOWO2_01_FULL_51_34]|nr:MAG: hypothetical protein A3B29_05125 [Candidatus Sungbacteria bacterium RIFCSPLOWO2_01_FULL_51_34]
MEGEPSLPFQSPEVVMQEKIRILLEAQPGKYTDPVTGEVDEVMLRADAMVAVRQGMRPK